MDKGVKCQYNELYDSLHNGPEPNICGWMTVYVYRKTLLWKSPGDDQCKSLVNLFE